MPLFFSFLQDLIFMAHYTCIQPDRKYAWSSPTIIMHILEIASYSIVLLLESYRTIWRVNAWYILVTGGKAIAVQGPRKLDGIITVLIGSANVWITLSSALKQCFNVWERQLYAQSPIEHFITVFIGKLTLLTLYVQPWTLWYNW